MFVTTDEAMQPPQSDEDRSQRVEIADWLNDLLYPMRMRSQDVQSKAKQAGFAWRTVQRTARDAGVVMKREGFGPNTVTYWSLAPVAPNFSTHANAELMARVDLPAASEEVERGEL